MRIGRQHFRNGVATLKIEKGGFTTTVTLPILPVLAATLAVGPCGDLSFVIGEKGKPLTKHACLAAGVPGSAHSVRKIAATRAAENGATVSELEAIFGWHGGAMAAHYTREANRVRLAREAMHLLANETATSIPAPLHEVRAAAEKTK